MQWPLHSTKQLSGSIHQAARGVLCSATYSLIQHAWESSDLYSASYWTAVDLFTKGGSIAGGRKIWATNRWQRSLPAAGEDGKHHFVSKHECSILVGKVNRNGNKMDVHIIQFTFLFHSWKQTAYDQTVSHFVIRYSVIEQWGGRGKTYFIRPFLKSKSTIRQLHSYIAVIACRKKNERENKRTKCHWKQLTVNEKQSLCCLIIFSLYIFLNWKILILPVKLFSKESRSLKKKKVLRAYWCLKLNFPLWYSSSELKKNKTVLVHFLVILCFSCPEHD